MDYVDILYAHIYDYDTPMEEICRGFNEAIEEGLTFYWATSNWHVECVIEALGIC
jgi:aryl-alcohol dehydrogenase-like predicted oxidoreductase